MHVFPVSNVEGAPKLPLNLKIQVDTEIALPALPRALSDG